MFKTSEVLYSVLLISICVLIMVYYKGSLNNIYNIITKFIVPSGKISEQYSNDQCDNDQCDNDHCNNSAIITKDSDFFMSQKAESSEELFVTEYEVTENADGAISDALKDVDV